ncbi:hypothetical protein SteCoe_14321 [Stentor coeruleus]|uniref:Serine/threonine specific protein phosphatases domain-containing protein n=1 Tax=Stentor coeruleus TaxID=5963 RepID=A0A1R2C673_9CILI|nr:hypothetical protein SteCoe_14321 [Stentor coeruleus]
MEPLKDPLVDRFLPDLQPPPAACLSKNLLFPQNNSVPDWKLLKNHLKQEGRVSKTDCIAIVQSAASMFAREPNLLDLMDPITIIGDIHGQFFDLLKILELAGDLIETKYLFLGDFVDRGSFSIEVLLLLYALKINYPNSVFLTRGNHESRQLTTFFNFRSECLYKYDLDTYNTIMESFDKLPLACIVNKKFLAVHGGISPSLESLTNIVDLSRFGEIPRKGLLCDLLWSDPVDAETGVSPEKFKSNNVRDCSYFYNAQAVNDFLKKSKLLCIIRAHEAQIDGYKMHKWNGSSEFPVVITVFSAPNYCDVYNNKGAILKFINHGLHVQQYNYTIHPYILPNFMNLFTWSVPFVIEKVLEIMINIMRKGDEKEIASHAGKGIKELENEIKENKTDMFKNKIKALGSMMKMLKTLQVENAAILELKGMCPDNKIPRGLLTQGRDAILGAIESFNTAKRLDLINEKRPE